MICRLQRLNFHTILRQYQTIPIWISTMNKLHKPLVKGGDCPKSWQQNESLLSARVQGTCLSLSSRGGKMRQEFTCTNDSYSTTITTSFHFPAIIPILISMNLFKSHREKSEQNHWTIGVLQCTEEGQRVQGENEPCFLQRKSGLQNLCNTAYPSLVNKLILGLV